MKSLLLLLLFLNFAFISFAEEKGTPAKSFIKSVTVFSDRARITRMSEIILQKGDNIFDITGIPEHLDNSSLTASLPKISDAILVSVEIPRKYAAELDPKELRDISKEMKGLSQQISLLNKRKIELKGEIATIKNLKIGVPQIEKKVDTLSLNPATWEKLLFFVKTQITTNQKEIRKIDKNLFDLGQKYEAVSNKHSKLIGYRRKSEKIARLKINAEKQITLNVELSYIIYNAGWFPIYDIHVEPKTGEVAISYFAQIAQTTGEDWDNAKIIMSTAIPAQSADLPYLKTTLIQEDSSPQYSSQLNLRRSKSNFDLSYISNINSNSSLQQVGTNRISTNKGTVSKRKKSKIGYNISNSFNSRMSQMSSLNRNFQNKSFSNIRTNTGEVYRGNELNVSGTNLYLNDSDGNTITLDINQVETIDNRIRTGERKGANKNWLVTPSLSAGGFDYRFPAAKIETVKSNGKVYRVLLKSQKLVGNKEYFATPIISSFVYLRCNTRNITGAPLLAGAANVFLGGDFIGETRLATVPENASLILGLGVDERIRVNRISSMMSKTSGIISKNRIIELESEISIVNYTKENIKVVVEERLPLSRHKNIIVYDYKANKKAINREQDGTFRNGKVHWRMNIPSGKSDKVISSYSIEHPLNFEITHNEGFSGYRVGLGKQIMKANKK